MQKDKDELVIGVLDIYGFEIFMVSQPKLIDVQLSTCNFMINFLYSFSEKWI
jgi:hypothetical protein